MENWILAKTLKGDCVKVRQGEQFSKMFIGEDGTMFDVSDLDFTENLWYKGTDEVIKKIEEQNKQYAEQQVERQEMLNKMLASMDANAIADHKAEIEEREYWRKLRGDIALEILRQRASNGYYSEAKHFTLIADMADTLFNRIYEDNKDFFKDK